MSEVMECGDKKIIEIGATTNNVLSALKKLGLDIPLPNKDATEVIIRHDGDVKALLFESDRPDLNKVQVGDLVVLTPTKLEIVSTRNAIEALRCEIEDHTILPRQVETLEDDRGKKFLSGYRESFRRHFPFHTKVARATTTTQRRHGEKMAEEIARLVAAGETAPKVDGPDLCALYAGKLWEYTTGSTDFLSRNAWEVVPWALGTNADGQPRGKRLSDGAGELNGSALAETEVKYDDPTYQAFVVRYIAALEKNNEPKLATMHYTNTTHGDELKDTRAAKGPDLVDFNSHVAFARPGQQLEIQAKKGQKVQTVLRTLYPGLDLGSPLLNEIQITFPHLPGKTYTLSSVLKQPAEGPFMLHDTVLEETFGNTRTNKPWIRQRSLRLTMAQLNKRDARGVPMLVPVSGVEMTASQREFYEDPRLGVVFGDKPDFQKVPSGFNLNAHLKETFPDLDLNGPEGHLARQTYALMYRFNPNKLRAGTDVIGLFKPGTDLHATYEALKEALVSQHGHQVFTLPAGSSRTEFTDRLVARVFGVEPDAVDEDLMDFLRGSSPNFLDHKMAALARHNPGSYFGVALNQKPAGDINFAFENDVFVNPAFWDKFKTDIYTEIDRFNEREASE